MVGGEKVRRPVQVGNWNTHRPRMGRELGHGTRLFGRKSPDRREGGRGGVCGWLRGRGGWKGQEPECLHLLWKTSGDHLRKRQTQSNDAWVRKRMEAMTLLGLSSSPGHGGRCYWGSSRRLLSGLMRFILAAKPADTRAHLPEGLAPDAASCGNSRKMPRARHRAEATGDHSLDLYATPPAHTALHLPSPDATHQQWGLGFLMMGETGLQVLSLKGLPNPFPLPQPHPPEPRCCAGSNVHVQHSKKKSCCVLYFYWGLRGEAKTHHRKCRLFLKSIGL